MYRNKLTILGFIFVFRISGLLPFKINFSKTKKNSCKKERLIFTRSYFAIIYNILLSASTVVSYYYSTLKKDDTSTSADHKESVFDNTINVFVIGIGTFIVIFTTSAFCIRQRNAIDLAESLEITIEKLSNFIGIGFNDDLLHLKMIKKFLLVISALWFIKFLSLCAVSRESIIFFYCITFHEFVVTMLFHQYSVILKVIRHLFENVNVNLQQLSKESKLCRKVISHDFAIEVRSSKFKHLIDVYLSLERFSKELSNYYSLPILLCLAHVFFTFILLLYYIIEKNLIENDFMNWYEAFQAGFILINYSIPIVTLTKSVTNVKVEVNIVEN